MLVNPVFSAYRRRSIPRIREIFEQAGIAVTLAETEPNGASSETARAAAAGDNIDAIVVCGGDGTVFDVLQGVAGSSIPIGILPFGTGNVLVQNLGLPRDPVAAARALLTARPVTVPLGRIACGDRSWYFAMAAGIGGHAAMMRAAHRYHKHRTGRLAYFAAGLEILATHPLQPFELDVTTTTGERRSRLASELIAVRVGELNLWRTGGGLQQPSLRLASVAGASRLRLARASFESLVLSAGTRRSPYTDAAAAIYEDALRVKATPLPNATYNAPLSLQADGEIITTVTSTSPAIIEMAGLSVILLAGRL
jgi:diacylglycerol kinase family enzyme